MVSDKLRWSWAVAARGSATNTSLPISFDQSLWDKSIEYDFFNETNNSTWTNQSYTKYELVNIATATVLVLVILVTVVGNVFVIAAILMERNLQNVANYLILSLAFADLLVACLVMPLGAVYEVSHKWVLGPELCDMWTSSDVLCCTASILHLVAIAIDRYWAVTKIDYIHHRTKSRIVLMIVIIWAVAFLVCVAPLLGWKDPQWNKRIMDDKICLVSQDIGYQIFATMFSFYLPLIVILILYWRIYQAARKRIRKRPGQIATARGTIQIVGPPKSFRNNQAVGDALAQAQTSGGIAAVVVAVIGRPLPTVSETTTAFTTVSSTNTSPEKTSHHHELHPDPVSVDVSPRPIAARKKKVASESKREKKAAKTLAIITGAFVVCWLPFFIIALLLPICHNHKINCNINVYLIAFFQWLGYLNSTLNPAIYTVFSPEFRNAFKKLLCRRRRNVGRRLGIRHYT